MKVKFIAVFASCLFCYHMAASQWYDPDKVGKKAAKIYAQAYEEAVDGKYDESLAHIGEAIELDPKFVGAYLSRAGIYADKKKYKASVQDFEKAFDLDSVYAHTYLLPLIS